MAAALLLLLVTSISSLAQSRETAAEVYRVTVVYGQTLKEMIRAGKYDWADPYITEKNFPIERKGKATVRIELVHFNRAVESDEALRELDKMGLRPATLPELLAFGAAYPEKQREFPIVALGSVWRDWLGFRFVSYLGSGAVGRFLRLHWLEDGWDGSCRFAAVRKSA